MVFLVAAAGAEDFGAYLAGRYEQAAGRAAALHYLQAADGAQVLHPREIG
jgi:hypothetical protein